MLIVTGVLIALSLEALWQYRADRSDERALLAGLEIEFGENVDALDRWIELHQSVAASAEAVLGYLEPAAEGTSVSVPDSLIALLGHHPTFDPELNSLDAALSSGQISLMRSLELQRALASWSRSLADAREEERLAAEHLYREYLPLVGEATLIGSAYSWLVRDVRNVMRGGDGAERPTSSSPVIVSRRLINALWVRDRLSRSAENELRILRSDLEDVLTLLDAEFN